MSKSFKALIRSDGSEQVLSKYVLEVVITDEETEVDQIWNFNVNSDVALPTFHSTGADDFPVVYSLVGTYDDTSRQMTSFDRFRGSIGNNRFYLRTSLGVIIKGPISGGPLQGQSFVGSGTWLKS